MYLSTTVIEEQEQHLKRLKDLMTDKDTIDIRCLKVFLVGPPGVACGKTITLNHLLKVIDNISSSTQKCQSTLLADCIQVIAFSLRMQPNGSLQEMLTKKQN